MTNYLARVAAAGARTGAVARPPVGVPSILPGTATSSQTLGGLLGTDGGGIAGLTAASLDVSPSALSTPPSALWSRAEGAESRPSTAGDAGPPSSDTTRADSFRPRLSWFGSIASASRQSRGVDVSTGDAGASSSPTPSRLPSLPPSPGGDFSRGGRVFIDSSTLETPLPRLGEGVGGEGNPGRARGDDSPAIPHDSVMAMRQESVLRSSSTAGDPVARPAALAAVLRRAVPTSVAEIAPPSDDRSEQAIDLPRSERAARPAVGRGTATGAPSAHVPPPPAVVRSTTRVRVVVGRLDVQVHVTSAAPTAPPARPPVPAARDSLAARYLDRFGLG